MDEGGPIEKAELETRMIGYRIGFKVGVLTALAIGCPPVVAIMFYAIHALR